MDANANGIKNKQTNKQTQNQQTTETVTPHGIYWRVEGRLTNYFFNAEFVINTQESWTLSMTDMPDKYGMSGWVYRVHIWSTVVRFERGVVAIYIAQQRQDNQRETEMEVQ